MRGIFIILTLFTLLVFADSAPAQSDSNDITQLNDKILNLQQQILEIQKKHDAEIDQLKKEIELVKQKNSLAVSSIQNQEANTVNSTLMGNAAAGNYERNQNSTVGGYQGFSPEISAIGDLIFQGGQIPKGETPDSLAASNTSRAQLREAEFGFSSPVDPYGRADMILAVEREDDGSYSPDIEEGYFTFTDLPYDLQARAGKFYSVFGKANMFHTHAMPWVDRPLPIRTFFGDEGLNDGGAEISWLVPNPWDTYIELSQSVQNNGNEADFAGSNANGLMYVTHLKNFLELSKTSTAELGGSFAAGTNGTGNSGNPKTNVEGLDFTYKWRPHKEGLYESVTWMNEVLFNQKDEGGDSTVNAHGWYSSLEYQFAKRWSVFGRYDYTQYPDSSSLHENSYSAGLTFRQSEFMFWRLQFEHTTGENYAGDVDRNQIFLQADFLIGQHPAHKY
jgi:hypothetical protein